MERKDGQKNEETMRIRMSTGLFNRIQSAKVPSGWGEEADSSFARHLIILGLNKVEQNIKEEEAKNRAGIEAAEIPESDKTTTHIPTEMMKANGYIQEPEISSEEAL